MLMASMVLAAGQRLAPVIMAAQALVTTGPQACLEGAQYLAKMADVRQNLGTLLEIFSDNEAATELIRPEGNKITATLGCDLTLRCRVLHRQQAVFSRRRADRLRRTDRLHPHGVRAAAADPGLLCRQNGAEHGRAGPINEEGETRNEPRRKETDRPGDGSGC